MTHPQHKDLVGYLVGRIMQHAPTLLIAIYALPDGRHSTSITSGRHNRTVYREMSILARTYRSVLTRVWTNAAIPAWYYLQFDAEHTPEMLYGWDLPKVVYGQWETPPTRA